ncbi:hypothetical protein EVAR_85271_1 [Eumeta japonica]|uniref:Mos1 transposase HTH domain-containing protein n=1 Tax=Eumeta variegata TaxID=151549 RepID=A0A4C1V6V6_EUMVA|nr:hypothetical protein EVAR_85271_1 [Eumeta japonica]
MVELEMKLIPNPPPSMAPPSFYLLRRRRARCSVTDYEDNKFPFTKPAGAARSQKIFGYSGKKPGQKVRRRQLMRTGSRARPRRPRPPAGAGRILYVKKMRPFGVSTTYPERAGGSAANKHNRVFCESGCELFGSCERTTTAGLSRVSSYNWYNSFKRGRTILIDDLREGRPSMATTEDNINAVRLMKKIDKKVTYPQIWTSLRIDETEHPILTECLCGDASSRYALTRASDCDSPHSTRRSSMSLAALSSYIYSVDAVVYYDLCLFPSELYSHAKLAPAPSRGGALGSLEQIFVGGDPYKYLCGGRPGRAPSPSPGQNKKEMQK